MTARPVLIAFVLLMAIALLPIASVSLPPLFDYPNHLARMVILAADGTDPILNRYYQLRWAPLPNLAMDAVVPFLIRFLPVLVVGRLFIAAILILMAGGILALHRAAWGRWHWWPLLGFLLLYNRILMWGFLNYLAGVGLAFIAATIWIGLRRWVGWRVAITAILALATFFSHMAAFGVLVIIMIGSEIPFAIVEIQRRDWRALLLRSLPLVLSLAAPAFVFLGWRNHAGGDIHFSDFWRKFDLPFSIFDNYHRPWDVFFFVLFTGTLLVLGVTKRLSLVPVLRWPLALLTIAYILSPNSFLTASGVDHRLPLPLFGLLIAASEPQRLSRRGERVLAVAALSLFLVRMGLIEQIWLRSIDAYKEDLRILNGVPVGTRLALASPDGAVNVTPIPQYHIATAAIFLRQAFVPTLFAYAAQQPVGITPRYLALKRASNPGLFWDALQSGDAVALAKATPLLRQYDMIAFAAHQSFVPTPQPCLTFIDGTESFRLYRIEHLGPGCF